MRIEQFRYILEVSKHRSISIAAENLHLSASALSQSIRQLENDLGTTLFKLIGKEMILTPGGHHILEHMHKIIHLEHQLNRYAFYHHLSTNPNLSGIINISTGASIANTYLPKSISSFLSYYPNISIDIREHSLFGNNIIDYFEMQDTDLLITPCSEEIVTGIRKNYPNYHIISLVSERIFAITNEQSSLKNKHLLNYQALLHEKLILSPNILFPEESVSLAIGHSINLDIILRSNNTNLIKQTILSENAIALTVGQAVLAHFADDNRFTCIPLNSNIKFQTVCIYKKNNKERLIEPFLLILQFENQSH